uniref:Sorting nexin-2 n=1 Tax=Neogobius melanostomus TaxID=47308 RepID=A0A8C6WPE8_9GOBI
MAASSERSPPPFPASEDTEAAASVPADGDSDEGEDIFVSNVRPLAFPPIYRVSHCPHTGSCLSRSAEHALLYPRPCCYATDLLRAGHSHFLPNRPLCSHHVSALTDVLPLQLEEDEAKDSFDVDVSVTSPEKIGQSELLNYLPSDTSLAMFKSKTFFVRRRFSDFLGLYEKLSVKQSLHGCVIPPPPEKSVVGMTKVKVGMDDPSSVEFVERRRGALERYLQRVVSHPTLLQDPDVREFLEREELPRAVNTQALSGAGFLKMINKASDAVNKMTIKMNESDTWFEDKFQEVESEEQQLRKLHVVVDSLVNHRKELCMNTAVFAKSMAMLGNSEDNTALSRALSQLAEVEDKMEQLHQEKAANDFFVLGELLSDYIRLLGAVRGCFDQRIRVWQRWQEAQSTLQKKREAEAKLLWANKPDKLQQAKDEITEWESRVTQYERDFDRIGMTVRKEVLRFEKEKVKDFKSHIIKYLESMLQSEQRVIKFWEAFLPEAKAVA